MLDMGLLSPTQKMPNALQVKQIIYDAGGQALSRRTSFSKAKRQQELHLDSWNTSVIHFIGNICADLTVNRYPPGLLKY